MTYIELATRIINDFTEEQQNSNITVSGDDDEMYEAWLMFADDGDCTLDVGHPYFDRILTPEQYFAACTPEMQEELRRMYLETEKKIEK